jgi:hypothetical protein
MARLVIKMPSWTRPLADFEHGGSLALTRVSTKTRVGATPLRDNRSGASGTLGESLNHFSPRRPVTCGLVIALAERRNASKLRR